MKSELVGDSDVMVARKSKSKDDVCEEEPGIGTSDGSNRRVCKSERSRCRCSSAGTSSKENSEDGLERLLKLAIVWFRRVNGDS